MSRSISHSEISTLLDCSQRHAFAYTGALTAGTALKPKQTAMPLRQGRAWGHAVASYHAAVLRTDNRVEAHTTLTAALDEDADQQREHGLYLPDEHAELADRLGRILDHYIDTTDPLPIDRLEHELDVPIPSRTGRRRSNLYRLKCFLDGIHVDDDGRAWIFEAKLRGQLMSLEQISLSRQTRWYAWAHEQATGSEVAGVIVDERLNAAPTPVKRFVTGSRSPRRRSGGSGRSWRRLVCRSLRGRFRSPRRIWWVAG